MLEQQSQFFMDGSTDFDCKQKGTHTWFDAENVVSAYCAHVKLSHDL